MTEIARLRELLVEATPGPWEHEGHGAIVGPGRVRQIAAVTDLHALADGPRPNAALVVTMHADLPSLLDRLEAAEAVAEAAREVLDEPHAYIGQRERAIIDAALRRYDEVSRG